ncbi:hypothetical protein L6R50_00195 [Myxococcota bacterium]|nr:hypothetical protein [Myxococcota bacterium]
MERSQRGVARRGRGRGGPWAAAVVLAGIAVGCSSAGRAVAETGPGEGEAGAPAWQVSPLDEARYVAATAALACASRPVAGAVPGGDPAKVDAVLARHHTTVADVAAFGAAANRGPEAIRLGAAVMKGIEACD